MEGKLRISMEHTKKAQSLIKPYLQHAAILKIQFERSGMGHFRFFHGKNGDIAKTREHFLDRGIPFTSASPIIPDGCSFTRDIFRKEYMT